MKITKIGKEKILEQNGDIISMFLCAIDEECKVNNIIQREDINELVDKIFGYDMMILYNIIIFHIEMNRGGVMEYVLSGAGGDIENLSYFELIWEEVQKSRLKGLNNFIKFKNILTRIEVETETECSNCYGTGFLDEENNEEELCPFCNGSCVSEDEFFIENAEDINTDYFNFGDNWYNDLKKYLGNICK